MNYLRIAAFVTVLAALPTWADSYRPDSLVTLAQRVEQVVQRRGTPVVMFDLDDTLINTRERNQRIFKDFSAQPAVRAAYPAEARVLNGVRVVQIHYLLADTLTELRINNPAFAAAAQAFWLSKFFTNEYCAHDLPNPGAVDYVRALVSIGATVVYLTGRDVPRMGQGTMANLRALGFPLGGTRARLVMKPDAVTPDLAFKISQFPAVGALGTVTGIFENEPANINAMVGAFPQAESIFLDTIHSPNAEQVRPGVYFVRDFRVPGRPGIPQ